MSRGFKATNISFPSTFFPKFSTFNHPAHNPVISYTRYNAWGMLASIDIKNCNPELIRSKTFIKNYVKQLCDLIGMKRYGPTRIEFFGPTEEVKGYSMFQFIETSCISGHFANKTNTAYIDLFSCKPYDPKLASEFTAKKFGSNEFDYSILLRK